MLTVLRPKNIVLCNKKVVTNGPRELGADFERIGRLIADLESTTYGGACAWNGTVIRLAQQGNWTAS